MQKYSIGLMSGNTVKFLPDEYEMAKAGIRNFAKSSTPESDLLRYLMDLGSFYGRDIFGNAVICRSEAIESIRKCNAGE